MLGVYSLYTVVGKSGTVSQPEQKVRDFNPTMYIENTHIEVVEELKLLGVKITSDLKWNSNTEYITKRGYKKLWMLRRLKTSGANSQELKDIYCKHVRSLLEYGAVVWHPGLTCIINAKGF